MRLKTTGFQATVPTPGEPWETLFVRDDRVAVINTSTLAWEGPLASVYSGEFAALPEPFASNSDGALMLPHDGEEITVFFAGDQALQWGWTSGKLFQGPVTALPRLGQMIPAEYRSEVDAVIQLPDDQGGYRQTLLFKGSRCALVAWGDKVRYEGPITGLTVGARWNELPAEWTADLDHAFPLEDSGAGYEICLIKGEQALTFNWTRGWRTKGAYAQALPRLAALPTAYQRLRLPAAGRFTGTSGGTRLDLRIDFQGPLPVVSGDLFTVSGSTTYYNNSFILDGTQAAPALPAVVAGTAKFAFDTATPKASVSVTKLAPGGTATVTLTSTDGATTQSFICPYTSRFLRTIDWEVDTMATTVAFTQISTTDYTRPPGLGKRLLTVPAAYADAGIELRAQATSQVPVSAAGTDLKWSDAELHAAMLQHFSGYRETHQWKLWTFIATEYADDEGVLGTMFDSIGRQRQGMAVFYDEQVSGGRAGTRRELRTYVHEMGHALNMLHSWDKAGATPPQPLGPRGGYGDLSFMNYDSEYIGPTSSGSAAYWSEFCYQFTPSELRHLRHAFYYSIVPGGNAFEYGSADRAADLAAPAQFAVPLSEDTGLRLELTGRDTFAYGEPVVAEVKLSLDGTRPEVEVAPGLGPKSENLTFLITGPDGATRPFRPMARTCGHHEARVTLGPDTPALYDSAYLGYGAKGLTFDQPGAYLLRAVYRTPDGSRVVSASRPLRVRYPLSADDERAGELLMGNQQGTLLAVLGSDSPHLQEGNDALEELLARYADHPLALYARMAKGTNAGRHFLTLGDKGIEVRTADTPTAVQQLGAVVETTLDDSTPAGVDNLTLNTTMRRLARAHARGGDLKQADAVLEQLVDVFRDKNVPQPVLATITEQAETTRTTLHEQA
ncbi:hypothetical protein [Streptomyces sp. NPDC016845]|uniref:hypothetical protein n=1 Tax=Streptomyces sp. NPDC016845 TaxID=3364972 RepID=UPI0037B6A27B